MPYLFCYRIPKAASHRNIVPESVLITSRGVVKLSGFGNCIVGPTEYSCIPEKRAKAIESILMTMPAIRAPEQTLLLRYLSSASSRRPSTNVTVHTPTDIWQLGCCMYALAYGQMPFGEEGLELGRQSSSSPERRKVLAVERIRRRIHDGNRIKSQYSNELADLIEAFMKVRHAGKK